MEPQQQTEKKTGRPRYEISRTTLETLILTHGYSGADCARFLNVSKSTITRLFRLYGLGIRQRYSQISDDELDGEVGKIIGSFHDNVGYRVCTQVLRGKGILLPLERVRQSMLRVNPEAVALRGLRRTELRASMAAVRPAGRTGGGEDGSVAPSSTGGSANDTGPRVNVRGPVTKTVWHVDSLEKLQRYKFTIHAAVDSHSRRILYLKVSDNNRRETVLQYFKDSVDIYGLPWKVETGHREENTGVDLFMLESKKNYKEPVVGRSRLIEKLMEDLMKNCLEELERLFQFLEWENRLSVDKVVDMFALHFVFRERIQERLDDFRSSHNKCRTLIKRWAGAVTASSASAGGQAADDVALTAAGSLPMSADINVLTPEEYNQLRAGLGASHDTLGIDLYLWAREQAEALIHQRANRRKPRTAEDNRQLKTEQIEVIVEEEDVKPCIEQIIV